jgi:hypothetical protein
LIVVDGRTELAPEQEREQMRIRCEEHFVIDDGINCFSQPSIVLHSATETIAVMDGNTQRIRELMERIVKEKLVVTLTGQLEPGVCSPTMIWATKP